MGDRANVVMRPAYSKVAGDGPQDIWLYAHSKGPGVLGAVYETLKRRQRWDDFAYLTRMVFCAMVKGEESGETGYGISTRMMDNEHDILVLDEATKTVSLFAEKDLENGALPVEFEGKVIKAWTFEEFASLSEDDVDGIEM